MTRHTKQGASRWVKFRNNFLNFITSKKIITTIITGGAFAAGVNLPPDVLNGIVEVVSQSGG